MYGAVHCVILAGAFRRLFHMSMFARAPSALWTELDGQFLLMNIENGAYFEVVGIGSAIWHLLETPRSEAEIVDHVTQRYRVDRDTCARDVRAFLDRLQAVSLIKKGAEPSPGADGTAAG